MSKTLELATLKTLELVTLLNINLNSFDTQVTTQASLSDEMKVFYSDYLIDIAKPELVHDQFAQKHPIPKGKGKTIEFRKYSPLAKALTPLVEGVTPAGNSLTVTVLTATVKQYGDYIKLSDILLLTAIDNNLVHATQLLGQQAGETLDTISREVMNSGTNVQYGDKAVLARYLLVGGEVADNNYFGVKTVKMAVTTLKNNKAKKIDGSYVAINHPDISYDLSEDPRFEEWTKYTTSEKLFSGEIGRIHGTRFVETTEAKVFHAEDLSAANRNLTVASVAGSVFTISEVLTAGDQAALLGRNIIVKGYLYTVTDADANTITVQEAVSGAPGASEVIYPGEAGAKGRDVYSTLIMGSNAYGTTQIEGGGLQNIVKQLGSSGTADPLNQRATTGWKATKVTEILVDEYMVRVETASTGEAGAN